MVRWKTGFGMIAVGTPRASAVSTAPAAASRTKRIPSGRDSSRDDLILLPVVSRWERAARQLDVDSVRGARSGRGGEHDRRLSDRRIARAEHTGNAGAPVPVDDHHPGVIELAAELGGKRTWRESGCVKQRSTIVARAVGEADPGQPATLGLEAGNAVVANLDARRGQPTLVIWIEVRIAISEQDEIAGERAQQQREPGGIRSVCGQGPVPHLPAVTVGAMEHASGPDFRCALDRRELIANPGGEQQNTGDLLFPIGENSEAVWRLAYGLGRS